MLTKLRSKLTYPHVVSTIALFMALTGGAFALQGKNTVDSGDIKKDNVKSSDIKSPNGVKTGDVEDNGLTGTDLDESTLGKVPSAANADNATNAQNAQNANNATNAQNAENANNATNAQNAQNAENANQANNADRVNNVRVQDVRYMQNNTGDSPQTIVNQGGLILRANCNGGDLDLRADSDENNATLSSAAIDTATDTVDANTVHNGDFDAATAPIDLLASDDQDQVLTIQYARPDPGLFGTTGATTVHLQADDDTATANCSVSGFVFSIGTGSLIIGPIFP